VCLALALLTKVYMLVLLLPLGAMVYCALRSSARRAAAAAVAIVLAILPAACWYWHAAATAAPGSPYADHVFYSVRQTAEVHLPPHPLLWSPEFYRRVLDDLSGVVLTPVGLAMALAGFLDRGWRRHAAWLLASLLLVAALPLKFYAMNYYYLAVLPPLCVLAGLGWQRVAERLRPGPVARIVLLLVLLLFSCRYWVRPVTVTAEEDRPVLAAAAAVRALTGPDEPVATMHGSTLDLLYYCDRPGWALSPEMPGLADRLADCRRQGARYLVVAGPAAEHLPGTVAWPAPVVQGDGFRVFRDF